MKITKEYLKRIIKEELDKMQDGDLEEGFFGNLFGKKPQPKASTQSAQASSAGTSSHYSAQQIEEFTRQLQSKIGMGADSKTAIKRAGDVSGVTMPSLLTQQQKQEISSRLKNKVNVADFG